jgi:hypothetical protein
VCRIATRERVRRRSRGYFRCFNRTIVRTEAVAAAVAIRAIADHLSTSTGGPGIDLGVFSVPQDPNNLRAERGPAEFDSSHRLAVSYIYELRSIFEGMLREEESNGVSQDDPDPDRLLGTREESAEIRTHLGSSSPSRKLSSLTSFQRQIRLHPDWKIPSGMRYSSWCQRPMHAD